MTLQVINPEPMYFIAKKINEERSYIYQVNSDETYVKVAEAKTLEIAQMFAEKLTKDLLDDTLN